MPAEVALPEVLSVFNRSLIRGIFVFGNYRGPLTSDVRPR